MDTTIDTFERNVIERFRGVRVLLDFCSSPPRVIGHFCDEQLVGPAPGGEFSHASRRDPR
jgi:hypothetical protein